MDSINRFLSEPPLKPPPKQVAIYLQSSDEIDPATAKDINTVLQNENQLYVTITFTRRGAKTSKNRVYPIELEVITPELQQPLSSAEQAANFAIKSFKEETPGITNFLVTIGNSDPRN